MFNFNELTIKDIEIVRPYFEYTRSISCDNTVGGSVLWADYFKTKYAVVNDTLIFCVEFPGYGKCFTVPLGSNVDNALDAIYEDCRERDIDMKFVVATPFDIEVVEKKFIVEKELMEDWSEYIYNATDLMNLPGRKYCGQRNHINNFKKYYPNYSYEYITPKDIDAVKKFSDEFFKVEQKNSEYFKEEMRKTYHILENMDKYKFDSLMLKVDGKIVAFAMGEKIKKTLYEHIEKADKSYRGAYQMMTNGFAKEFGNDVLYINREDAAGDKGLIEAKKQYKPVMILEKYYLKVLKKM